MAKTRPSKRDDNELTHDPVMDEQIFRFLAAFTQIQEENVRERLIQTTEWMCRHPEQARAILMNLIKH
jgi:hypothetical protein